MKTKVKQQGFGTEYIIAGLAGLALLVALAFGVHRYAEGERKAGYAQAEAAYAKRDNKALAEANAKIEEYRKKEAAGAQGQVDIVVNLKKENEIELAKKDRTIASLRNGALKLRDPGARSTTVCSTGATPTSPTNGSDGKTGSELSGQAAQFLSSEASRADQIVLQLQACQATVLNDRKIVNGN